MHTDCTASERHRGWKLRDTVTPYTHGAQEISHAWDCECKTTQSKLHVKRSSDNDLKANQGRALFFSIKFAPKPKQLDFTSQESSEHTFRFAWGSPVREGWRLGLVASGHREPLPWNCCQLTVASVDLVRIPS